MISRMMSLWILALSLMTALPVRGEYIDVCSPETAHVLLQFVSVSDNGTLEAESIFGLADTLTAPKSPHVSGKM